MSSTLKLSNFKEEEEEVVEILDSSYELFTPVKTRLSHTRSGKLSITPTHTRSGRKIKKVQYMDYEIAEDITGFTPEKTSALKEINLIKNDFSQLSIANEISTPSKEDLKLKKTQNVSTEINATPRGKIISPGVTYSKSGRKIKKIQHSESETEVSDAENINIEILEGIDNMGKRNILKSAENKISKEETVHTPSKRRLLQNNTPINLNPNTPSHSRSSSEIKKFLQYTPVKQNVIPSEGIILTKSGRKVKKIQYDVVAGVSKDHQAVKMDFSLSDTSRKAKKSSPESVTPTEYKSPNTTFTKSGRKVKKKLYDEREKTNSESSECDNTESENESSLAGTSSSNLVKPSVLYEDDNKLGKQMFGFQTPKHRNAMLEKASSTKMLKTQKLGTSKDIESTPKTPYNMRKRLKKEIFKEIKRQSLDSFLEDSGSDYVPSSSSSEDSGEDENGDDEDESADENNTECYEISGVTPLDQTTIESAKQKLLKRRTKCPVNSFIFTSEDYFENQNTRMMTSNNTLSQLNTPRFKQEQLVDILSLAGSKHQYAINELTRENEAMYTRWLFSMNEGFNILVYGIGSKRRLLNTFHRQFLSKSKVVVVNGYFPGLILKHILDCITNTILRLKIDQSQQNNVVEFIGRKLRNKNDRLFLLVHNIDGISLRCDKIQSTLAQLSADPNIHLIASSDHINSALLWDQKKLSQFNFTWEDGTSFLPYLAETSYENSLTVQQTGQIALAGLKNIFKALNSNSRKIFKLLLERQLAISSSKSDGILFSELYRECRDSFLVSSDIALRAQLTEFFDHQLIKWKQDNLHLVVLIDTSVLKQFHYYLNNEFEK